MLLSGGVLPANAYAKSPSPSPAALTLPALTSGTLPEFPNNLTHFIFIVRENHVFDDYLGDCSLDINKSCDDNAGWTSPTSGSSAKETSASGDQLDTPYLHDMARDYAVFDNYYSGVDPYSAQAHAFMFAETSDDSSDSCVTAGDQGTGSGTAWGIYNSSSVAAGSCGSSSDSGSQSYPTSSGTVFDRYLGTNVAQTKSTIPFLDDGDILWELSSPGCTSKVPTETGIPGSLPGNSEAVEHVSACTNGWWYNTSSSKTTMPPVVNSNTGAPQMLFVCEYACTAPPQPNNDQDEAYGFVSYVADYGLPTYTFIELFNDHPGAYCTAAVESTCIQWNDASTNLIVEDIMNSTSAYKDNTVIAITEDDTQDGANGDDHVNDGRRLPLVIVAPHDVEKQGAATGTSCGISASYHCGYVVHQTFNTSNINAVMERVEMNVNPNVFVTGAPSGNKDVFPMLQNDYLAEGNPLEPLWICGPADAYCNTGASVTRTLTSTSISPNPINAAVSTPVSVSATALDQNGAILSTATFAWNLTPTSLGSLSSASGAAITFNAGASAGNGRLCENATYSAKTIFTCVLVSVSSVVTLSSVTISPAGTTIAPSGYADFTASSLGSNSQTLTSSTIFNWTINPATLGSLNKTSNTQWVNFTALTSPGNVTLCLNGTYSHKTVMSCDIITIAKAGPILSSVTVTPASVVLGSGGTQEFYAKPLDQYGNLYTAGVVTYQWGLNPSTLGNLSSVSGTVNDTILTAGATGGITGKLTIQASSGAALASSSSSVSIFGVTATQSATSGKGPLNVTFTATAAGGVSPYGYTWNFGDGNTSTTQNPVHEYCKVGSFTPKVTASDNAGHTATSVLTAVSITSSSCGSSTTQLTATATGAPTTGTVPLTVDFTGSASGGTPAYTYAWNFGDGARSSAPSPVHTYNVSGKYTAMFWVNDSASHSASSSVSVTVNNIVKQSVSVAMVASPKSGSAPLAVSFSAAASGGTGSYTGYAWTFGDTSTGTGTDVQHTYTTAGTFPVEVIATDTGGTTGAAFTNITVTAVTPPTLVSVSVSPTYAALNTGDNRAFTATPTCTATCPAGTTYAWTLTNSAMGSLSGATSSTATFTAASTAGTVGLFVNASLNGITVSSSAVVITIASTSTPSPAPWYASSPGEYILIGLIAAVVVALIAVILIRSRRTKQSPPAQYDGNAPPPQYGSPPPQQYPPEQYPGMDGQAPPPAGPPPPYAGQP
jgi:PKD repeat protein